MKNNVLKRIFSYIVTASMIISCVPSVFAYEQTFSPNTYASVSDWAIQESSTSDVYVCTDESRSGAASLYVGAGDAQMYLPNVWLKGTYTAGVWVKCNPDNPPTRIGSMYSWYNDGSFTLDKTEGEWYHYSRTFTMNNEEWNDTYPAWLTISTSEPIIIDDVTITDANGNNVIGGRNYGFESFTISGAPYEQTFSPNTYATISDWTVDSGSTADVYSCIDESKSGMASLYVGEGTATVTLPNVWLKGTYTTGIWVKCNPNNPPTGISSRYSWYSGGGFTLDKIDGEWRHYSRTFTMNTEEWNDIYPVVLTISTSEPIIIDDVTITDANGTNIISGRNYGFESYTVSGMPYEQTFSPNKDLIITDWKINDGCTTDIYMCTEESKSGLASLYIGSGEAQIYLPNVWLKGTYTAGVWVKCNPNNPPTGISSMYSWYNDGRFTLDKIDGEWRHYSRTFTMNTEEWNDTYPAWIMVNTTEPILIDDVTITDAYGNNILSARNYGFESYYTRELTNVTAYPAASGNAAVISWTNPNFNISSIKISQDGTELSDISVDLAALARNEVVISGLENYREYTFTVTAVIDSVEYSSDVIVVPNADVSSNYAGDYSIGAWNVLRSDAATDGAMHYANVNTTLDFEEKKSGDAAFKFSGYMHEIYSNVWEKLTQKVTLRKDRKYKLSLYAKGEGLNKVSVIETSDDENCGSLFKTVMVVNDSWETNLPWNEYTCYLATTNDANDSICDTLYEDETYEANIQIAVEKLIGSFWIDDVALYEVDIDTNEVVSGNILEDSGFEFDSYSISAKCGLMDGDDFFETGIIEPGNIAVKAIIRNESAGNDFNTAVAAALYNNGRLVTTQTASKVIPEGKWYEPDTEYTFTFNIPEENADLYTVKVFFWNKLSVMNPLGTAVEFKTAE